jgi:hypothetical protein
MTSWAADVVKTIATTSIRKQVLPNAGFGIDECSPYTATQAR